MIGFGHLLVGGSALVFAVVMMAAGAAPDAGLGGVFLWLGLLLALVATAFTCTAILVLRRSPRGRGVSLVLSIVEVLAGVAMAVAAGGAVRSYGAFEPWRSPLLVPSTLLVVLGLAGIGLEVLWRRRHSTGSP
jgi:hypothetical protein